MKIHSSYSVMVVLMLMLTTSMQAQDKVGIGTLIPDYRLHIMTADSSILKLENSTPLNINVKANLFFKTGTRYSGAIKTIGTSAQDARLGLFTFASPTSAGLLERMSILDNGDVGIGTNTPIYKLDINGRARLRHTLGLTAGLWFNKADNTLAAFAGMQADTTWGLYNNAWKFIFDTDNSRLGIGFVTPQYPLAFQSVVGDKISLYGGGGLPNADHYGFGIQGSLMQLFTPVSTADIAFGYGRSAAFTERMRIKGDGNVGIGTPTPATKLQILGGADAGLTSNGFIQLGPTTSGNLVIDNNEIVARNNGLEADMWIQQDDGNLMLCGLGLGSVGVGVSAASGLATGYALSVKGKIIAEEVRVQANANWPDYVFNHSYPLMPLDELQKSIHLQKHLPNIPSAKEVEENGILLGDMQKRMMEKIEELTLYVLDLHEINKHQQAEIEILKASIEHLKK